MPNGKEIPKPEDVFTEEEEAAFADFLKKKAVTESTGPPAEELRPEPLPSYEPTEVPEPPTNGLEKPSEQPPDIMSDFREDLKKGRRPISPTLQIQKLNEQFNAQGVAYQAFLAGTISKEEMGDQVNFLETKIREESKELQDYLLKSPPTGELTFMDRIQEIKDRPGQLAPFLSGAIETSEMMELIDAVHRLDDDIASNADVLLLLKYVDNAERDTTFWYKVMDVVAQLPAFAGELLLTGGIYTAAKKATIKGSTALLKNMLKKGTKELLKKKLTQIAGKKGGKILADLPVNIISGIGGATAQTVPAGITRITAGTFKNIMPEYELTVDEQNQITGSIIKEGDNVLLATIKALGDQWVETVSERSGGLFNSVGRAGKEAMIRHGILRAFLKTNPKAKVSDFMGIVKRAGYDGVVSEMLEERVAEIGRATLGLGEWKLPTREQLAVELVAFSIPGLAISGINKATSQGKIKYEQGTIQKEITEGKEVKPTEIKEKEEIAPVEEKKEPVPEQPSYSIGEEELTKEQAESKITEAKSIEDLEGISISNDPELQSSLEQKAGQLTLKPKEAPAEEVKPPISEEKPKEEIVYETEEKKNRLEMKNNKLYVIDNKTNQVIREIIKKEVIDKYKEAKIDEFKKGKKVTLQEGMSEKEVTKEIIYESDNPQEVAQEWLREKSLETPDKTADDHIASKLMSNKISRSNLERWGPVAVKRRVGGLEKKAGQEEMRMPTLKYTSKDPKKTINADILAMEISEESGMEITPQMIVDFIFENPTGSATYFKGKDRTPKDQLADKFFELTGFELTGEYAKKLTEFKEKPEKLIEAKISELHSENAEIIDRIASAIGAKKDIIGQERTNVIKDLQKLVSNFAEEFGLRGEALYKKVRDFLKDKIEPKFLDDNRGEIMGEFEKEVKPEEKPEEKAKENLVIYADESVGFVTDLGKNIKTFFKELFTARGLIPKRVFDLKIKMEGSTKAMLNDVKHTSAKFKKALRKEYGTIKIDKKELNKIDNILKGELSISEIPEGIRESVISMRNQIDALSKRFIDEGLVEGELIGKIQENLGVYMTRSYEVHDNPKFKEGIPAEIKNRAINFLRNKYPDLSVTELKGVINEILDRPDSPLTIIKSGKLGEKDLGILKKRKDIAPEIRALMGEYTDPLLNYARSITKMAHFINKSKFLAEVKDVGMNNFLFEKSTEIHFREIAAEGSRTMAPLNGLYTTPEIAEAFENIGKTTELPSYLRHYMKINGIAKLSKTVFSYMTHVRNLIGNTGFAVMNGHWRAGKFTDAIKTTINNLATLDNQEFREKYKHYLELNIVGESTRAGELQDIIKDATQKGNNFDNITDNRAIQLVKSGMKLVNDLYMTEDDVWKIYAFENEMSRYKKAFPEMPKEELETKVAEIVRNTYPTYSLVPEVIKKIRRFPLAGTFVSFPAEVIRTTYNTVELTIDEIKNPTTRKIGIERLSGLILATTLTGAAKTASALFYGVSDDEDKAIRRFLPPWSRNSILISLSKVKNGKYEYIDLGYSDPHTYLKSPVIALLKAENIFEGGIEAVKEFFEPFLSEEMLATRLLDIARNKKKTGGQVYNEQAPVGDKLADISIHFAEALEPGVLSSFRRIWKGVNGTINEYGREYDPVTEIIALFSGQRVSKLDVSQAFSFKSYRFSQDIKEAKRIYSKVNFRKGKVTKQEKEDAYQEANTAIEKLFNEIVKDYNAAGRLGVPISVLKKTFKRNRMSEGLIRSISKNSYTELKKYDSATTGVR